MAAFKIMYVEAAIDIVRTADILDDIQALADRNDLGQGCCMHHRIGEFAQIAVIRHQHLIGVADALVFNDFRIMAFQGALDQRHRLIRLGAFTDQESQFQFALKLFAIERKTG